MARQYIVKSDMLDQDYYYFQPIIIEVQLVILIFVNFHL